MQLHLFEQVAEQVRAIAPEGFGTFRQRSHRRGVKIWFGAADGRRDHFEAQWIADRHLATDEARAQAGEASPDHLTLEVGFHAEFRDEAHNQAALDAIVAKRKQWKKLLGDDAEAGAFLGNGSWRRFSEVWFDVDPDDPDLSFEIASRLVDYIEAVQPVLDEL